MEGQALYDLTSAHLSLLLCGPKVTSSLWQEVCGRKFRKILTGFSTTWSVHIPLFPAYYMPWTLLGTGIKRCFTKKCNIFWKRQPKKHDLNRVKFSAMTKICMRWCGSTKKGHLVQGRSPGKIRTCTSEHSLEEKVESRWEKVEVMCFQQKEQHDQRQGVLQLDSNCWDREILRSQNWKAAY